MGIETVAKVAKGASTLKKVKENPVGFAIDIILIALLSTFLPFPIAVEIVQRFKVIILAILCTLLLLAILMIAMLLNSLAAIGNFHMGNSGQSSVSTGFGGSIPDILKGYIEAGFSDTDIPSKNPLGGSGMENTQVTMYYHDPNYTFFDHIHTGIDLIPSDHYYQTNQAYLKTKELIVFATMNGKATFAVDQFGANYVDVVNSENTMLTRYVHLATSFITTDEQVVAGQPIGIMGQTGEATGVHLHYELRVNQGGTFVTVNPLGYIH